MGVAYCLATGALEPFGFGPGLDLALEGLGWVELGLEFEALLEQNAGAPTHQLEASKCA